MTDEQRKLVTENHNLIYSFLNKHGFDIEEYYDLAAIGLCRAAKTYDESKGAFSTYAYRAMLTDIDRDIRYRNRDKRIPEHLIDSYNAEVCNDDNGSSVELVNYIPSNVDIEREVIGLYMFDRYLARLSDLSERDKLIFWLLLDGYTHREIGEIVGCSYQNIRPVKNKIIRRLNRERLKGE